MSTFFRESACLSYLDSSEWICESKAQLRAWGSSFEIYGTTPHFTGFAFLVEVNEESSMALKQSIKWPTILGSILTALVLAIIATFAIYAIQRNRKKRLRTTQRERMNNLEFLDIDVL